MHWARRAASRADCTAGRSRAIRTPMIAMTTNSSIKVKPPAALRRLVIPFMEVLRKNGDESGDLDLCAVVVLGGLWRSHFDAPWAFRRRWWLVSSSRIWIFPLRALAGVAEASDFAEGALGAGSGGTSDPHPGAASARATI